MKQRKTKQRLWLFAAASVLALGLHTAALADTNATVVTIYTTNDMHGNVEGSDTAIGLAQVAGIAASTPDALLADAGDATQGASFATITQGADVIRLMNAAGYDAMAAGNHEFDYGAERLLANAALADFPILSANVYRDGEPLLAASTVVEAAGHKIGFIGLTTTATATSTNPAQLAGVTFGDEAAAAAEQIAALKDQTDAIILVCHLGDDGNAVKCTSFQLLEALDDEELAEVTAVIDGHSHTVENTAYTEGGVSIPVVQTGTGMVNLGVLTLTFDENDQASATVSLMDSQAAAGYSLNEAGQAAVQKVESVLAEIREEQDGVLDQVLCTADTPLWGGYIYFDYAEPRIVETSYGDFVTDAFLDSAKIFAEQNGLDQPVIAVENGGGISAALPVGTVTKGDVLNAFNHGNMVEVLEITPAQLYTALENGLVVSGQDETGLLVRTRVSGSFLQAAGFVYEYDPAGEAGAKVTSVVLDDGTVLDRNDGATKILMATNNYVTTFAGFKEGKKLGELGGEDLIVEEYIQAKTADGTVPLTVPTTANRIRIANDQSPASYQVLIPVEDVSSGDWTGKTVHLRIDGGAAAEYVPDENGCVSVTLDKGAHTLYLLESSDGIPVYVNNYSGSGTVTTKDGYYHLGFKVDANAAGGWKQDANGWWYSEDDGTYPAGEWAFLPWEDTYCWYHFDSDGYMETGWIEDGGYQYYLHPLHDGSCGHMYTGRQQIDGVWYEFSTGTGAPEGALISD